MRNLLKLICLVALVAGCSGRTSSDVGTQDLPEGLDIGQQGDALEVGESRSGDAGGGNMVEVPLAPSAGFLERKAQYLEACLADHGPGKGGLYGQVCRVYSGDGGVNVEAINAACDKVDSREDTSDFAMAALLRLLYLDRDRNLLAPEVRDRIRATVLGFRYWLDEPGTDKMCFWSENHQALFHSAELLAGQLFPDETFNNSGMTGKEHVEHALPRIERWLKFRAMFGFSEWHSNVYFNEDIPALANLAHFAEDARLRTRAAVVLDLVALDFAFNSFDGCFATVHGRTYEAHIIGPCNDSTADASWLALGLGERKSSGNFSAAFLVTGDYFPPPLLEQVAADVAPGFEHRQHDSIDVADGPLYGIGYEEPDDVVFWAGMAALAAPEVILGTSNLLDTYDLWDGFLFGDVPEPYKSMIKDASGKPNLVQLAKDLAVLSYGIALEGMDTYTWRTPDYQLSGAQDYKGGFWASQTHLWQATLTAQAHVFTSYAGNVDKGGMGDLDFAGLWTGNWLPRVTLYRNVGVIQYRIQPIPMLDEYLAGKYGHAYFPRGLMDEWKQEGQWVAGRAGTGLVALYSQHPVTWAEDNDYELIGPPGENVWIVELASVDDWTSLDEFLAALVASKVEVSGAPASDIRFVSPSAGEVKVGWDGSMTVKAQDVDLGPYLRWDNAAVKQEFGTTETRVLRGEEIQVLDFEAPARIHLVPTSPGEL
jgi:hypothetical protein